ncbi:MAG: transporter substrate-binding domain-containing protein [Planctomycetota bacterium]
MLKACCALLAAWCFISTAAAGSQEMQGPVRVGLRVAAPFVIDDGQGGYEGLAIDAWEAVADFLELEWEAQPMALGPLLEAVEASEVDLAVGALTVTSEREERLDFSHPILSSGLGIAVRKQGNGPLAAVMRVMLSPDFLVAIASLGLVLLGVGALVWLAERRRNPEQFTHGPSGLLDGFWFSAVTMTTVGYGDKAPISGLGRALALVWMFASIIIISGFTGAIASSVTVDSLDTRVRSVDDLDGVRVGVLAGSAAEAWVRAQGVGLALVDDLEEALDALADGSVQAVVHDRPILSYLVREAHAGELAVLPQLAVRQNLAFALPSGSNLREEVNRALLDHFASPLWNEERRVWLGE